MTEYRRAVLIADEYDRNKTRGAFSVLARGLRGRMGQEQREYNLDGVDRPLEQASSTVHAATYHID